ncbi:MAG: DUF4292 domain-containing protein [Bacteroidota bacterium]
MKTVKSKFFFCFLFLISFLLLLSACKAKKKLLNPSTEKCKIDRKNAKTLTALIKQNQVIYNTFSGKIKTTFIVDEKETDFIISLRMRKDSIIWASISPALGIEAMRIVATKDSIHFIDRVHNNFFSGSYDTLGKILNTEIDLEILQSLLVGNNVEFYEEDEKLRAGIDSCRYLLGTIRKRKLRKVMIKGKELKEPAQNIWLSDSTFKISRILFREFNSGREFDAYFENFQKLEFTGASDKQMFIPYNYKFVIKAERNIQINLKYIKVNANKSQTFPFTIPANYEKIEKK